MTEPTRTGAKRRWCQDPPATRKHTVGPSRRVRWILLVLGGILALAGTAAGMVSWLSRVPRPYFVPCWVTQFDSPVVQPNTAAQRDREALHAGRYFRRTAIATGTRRHLLVQRLEDLAQHSASDQVVVYLSAYAGTEQDGLFLLPADFSPIRPSSRLRLSEVLQRIRDCPARQKLLVLDVLWPAADPRLGILGNDAACRIAAELEAVKDPRRLVLCAGSPGQIAQRCEPLGRSVFGYYFEQALRGDADGYNQKRQRNGRVSVQELARFVRARVDRWAVFNRQSRQTPVLLGDGTDFDLIALDRDRPKPLPPELPSKPYPKWLCEGWKLRDAWLDDGSARLNPRLCSRLEETTLRAERKWRFGGDPEETQRYLQSRIAQLRHQLQQTRSEMAGPEPHSLAARLAAGYVPDPKLGEALSALLSKLDSQALAPDPKQAEAARVQATAEFEKTAKTAPALDVALAVFAAALDDTECPPPRIRLLDDLLRQHHGHARWMETFTLRCLAGLTEQVPPGEWPGGSAHQLLTVVAQQAQALDCAESLPWIRDRLGAASQLRHDGERLLFSPGYAPNDEVARLLTQAAVGYEGVLACQEALRDAHDTFDTAMAWLPAYVPYLEYGDGEEMIWPATVDATSALGDLLTSSSDVPVERDMDGSPSDQKQHEAEHRIEQIRQKTAEVRSGLAVLHEPFGRQAVDRLLERCGCENASPEVREEVNAILATPLLAAADRVKLCNAGRDLARRLHQKTIQLDRQENLQKAITPLVEGLDAERAEQTESPRTRRRAQTSMALLRLGTIDTERLAACVQTPVEKQPAAARRGDRGSDLAAALSRAWGKELPDAILLATELQQQDRLGRVFPPPEPMNLLDDPATNPSVRLRRKRNQALWAWLADRYRYEARDGANPGFYANLFCEYSLGLGEQRDTYLNLVGPRALDALQADGPAVTCTLDWKLLPPDAKLPVEVDVLNPAMPWLRVQGGDTSDLATTAPLAYQVSLGSAVQSSGTPGQFAPRGFMVRFRAGGRTFHYPVSVPALSQRQELFILLSAETKKPEPPLTRIRLRPLKTPQPVYLFVKNTSSSVREVVVQLTAGVTLEKRVDVGPRQTQPVKFDPAAPSPAKQPLPWIEGPLRVSLLDAKDRRVLARETIPIEIAYPRQYVKLASIAFESRGPSVNRLAVALRGVAIPPGGPCVAELVLPPNRIPGLLGVKDGAFQGVLPPDGRELALFAKNLRLAEDADEQGFVYLTVDGVTRAFLFRATLARGKNATTPTEDIRPALRLEAPATARSGPDFPVQLEADNAPAGSTLEVALGQGPVGGSFTPQLTRKLPQARRQRVSFSPNGKGGALELTASIEDWSLGLDTTGIVGQRVLRARLLTADGREVCLAEQAVVLGNRPPRDVQFVRLPKQASNTKPLVLEAMAMQSVPEISEVLFFVGQPSDGEIPKGVATVKGRPVDSQKLLWAAELPLKPSMKGPTPISAQLTNAAGLSATTTGLVQMVDNLLSTGSIRGTVWEGPRRQVGVEVVLQDGKNQAKAKTKTDAQGDFLFEHVQPGRYTTSASKPVSGRGGAVDVTVEDQHQASVTIELWL